MSDKVIKISDRGKYYSLSDVVYDLGAGVQGGETKKAITLAISEDGGMVITYSDNMTVPDVVYFLEIAKMVYTT